MLYKGAVIRRWFPINFTPLTVAEQKQTNRCEIIVPSKGCHNWDRLNKIQLMTSEREWSFVNVKLASRRKDLISAACRTKHLEPGATFTVT